MNTTIEQLPIGQLKPAKDNARRDVGDVAELAASIKAVGLLEPIVATRQNGHHLIVCGARRFAAAKQAGLEDVPVIVREFSEAERVEAMLIENLQRESLAPLEEAEAYSRLVELGHSQRKLAERVGRSQSHVSKRLALLQLPAAARKKLDSGGITLEEAVDLTKLREHPERLARVVKELGTWHSVENLVGDELAELEREKKIEAETAAIKREGIPLRQMKREGPYYWRAPAGTMIVGDGWEGLDIPVARHAKEPCHAAAVGRDGERVYLCTEPARHAREDETAKRKTKADRDAEARRKHEKELKVARTARHDHIRTAVLGKLPKGEAIELLVDGLIFRATAEASKIACRLLDLDPTSENGSYIRSTRKLLTELAAKNERERMRVGVALAIAGTEEFLGGPWHSWGRDDKAYLELLERRGYVLSPAERRELTGKAPRRTGAY